MALKSWHVKLKDAMRSEVSLNETAFSDTRKYGVLGVFLDLISIQNLKINNLEQGMDQMLFILERRLGFLGDAMKMHSNGIR